MVAINLFLLKSYRNYLTRITILAKDAYISDILTNPSNMLGCKLIFSMKKKLFHLIKNNFIYLIFADQNMLHFINISTLARRIGIIYRLLLFMNTFYVAQNITFVLVNLATRIALPQSGAVHNVLVFN